LAASTSSFARPRRTYRCLIDEWTGRPFSQRCDEFTRKNRSGDRCRIYFREYGDIETAKRLLSIALASPDPTTRKYAYSGSGQKPEQENYLCDLRL
jgi:hypothetical protein